MGFSIKEVNMQQKTLYIPSNIKTRQEFFEGYGATELYKTIGTATICSIFCLILYAINHSIALSVVIMLSGIAASIMFVTKDRNNQSVLDQIVLMIRFSKSQKKYQYNYTDEWRSHNVSTNQKETAGR